MCDPQYLHANPMCSSLLLVFKVSEDNRKIINCRSTNIIIRGVSLSIVRKIRDAFDRLLIRRAYNNANYELAAQISRSKLDKMKDKQFLLDIICRSMYNLEQFSEVILFVKEWELETHKLYAEKSRIKISIRDYREPSPEHFAEERWNSDDLLSNWYQEGSRIWLRHPWGWTFWDMPETYQLDKTSKSLLRLALDVVLSPWLDDGPMHDVEQREFGSNLALSYSGGIDSTAAALLLPKETILAYHERSFDSMLTHDLAKSLFNKLEEYENRIVLRIPSNHEKIRTFHDLPNGFSTEFASASHLILLADHLDLGGIAFGTPIDNTWLKKGKQYRDFSSSKYFIKWTQKFESAGLHYVLPINHVSEAGALEICRQSKFADHVNSCLRGENNHGCGNCWKCFHKNGPLGRRFNIESKEINAFLNQKPLRTAQHALWALKKMNLENRFPHLAGHLQEDLSWWEMAYPVGLDIIPNQWRDGIKEKTEQYLSWMEEPYSLEKVDLNL